VGISFASRHQPAILCLRNLSGYTHLTLLLSDSCEGWDVLAKKVREIGNKSSDLHRSGPGFSQADWADPELVEILIVISLQLKEDFSQD